MTSLVPYLTVHDASAADRVLRGGVRGDRRRASATRATAGSASSSSTIAGDPFYLSDEFHEYGAYAPATLGHSSCALVLGVDDAHAVYAAAVAAGASPDREPSDQGDEVRGWLVDPFGHRWAIHSPALTRAETWPTSGGSASWPTSPA